MKTQKKGFTLIELMVVIVIIGILAAIAIPKLFGMSAKAKASEVGPAAGTWSKLQQAYLMETGYVGGSKQISYKLPGDTPEGPKSTSANFTYNVLTSVATNQPNATWTATPKTKLEDCDTSNVFSATFYKEGTVSAAIHANCESLTPNFTKLQ